MAAKNKQTARLESEIEKCRSDANWARAVEIAKQITSKSPGLEQLVSLVSGERHLEEYLQKCPPNESNIASARSKLQDARRLLIDVYRGDNKHNFKQEAILLLGKLLYAQGEYQEALNKFEEAGLDSISQESMSLRKLRLVGEAYAIKGLCIEKLPAATTSKYKQAEREEQIIQCFEKSGDINLLQLQEMDKHSQSSLMVSNSNASAVSWNIVNADELVGPIVETAIQRSPVLYIQKGELSKGIGRFRDLLKAVECRATQSLRQTLARQLAEVLLRGVCEKTYKPVSEVSEKPSRQSLHPSQYTGDRLFVPKDENEETLLLLLIAESMANREAVLNRSPEFADARELTFNNTTAVYDLLTIALVKRAQFNMLTESFERAMRFSFDEFHIWYQFALSLICAGKFTRALLVLKECHVIEPKNITVLIQAAKLCFENLHMLEEGVEFAQKAVEVGEDHPHISRAYLALGVGFSLQAEEARLQVRRQELHTKALNLFHRAHSHDNNGHVPLFLIGLQYASLRQIPEALKYVRKALCLKPDHVHSLHLLALLLSAQKQYAEALQLIEAALAEYSDNFSLYFTKCKLQELVSGPDVALHACRELLQMWRDMYEDTANGETDSCDILLRGSSVTERTTPDKRSFVHLQLSEFSDRDSGSVRAESVAASRVEHALSEVASSIGSSQVPKSGPHHTWGLQMQIWLNLAELYLSQDKIEEAHACVQEAGSIYPFSHLVSYMRGRIHQSRMEYPEAKTCYQNAVSINPSHLKSLQYLGMVLHYLGSNQLAEKVLREAVNADPTCCQTWHDLGCVLQSLGEHDMASECLLTAVDMEGTSPVISFSVIPRTFY